jgi:hypothetical protein
MNLYLFEESYGCCGEIYSAFLANEEEVNSIYGLELYLGEILGKHSEVTVTLNEEQFTKLDLKSETIEDLSKALEGKRTLTGVDIIGRALDELAMWDDYEEKSDMGNPRYA